MVTGGDIIGTVYENSLFKEHRVMIPPGCQGEVTFLAAEGLHTIDDEMC